MTEKEEVCIKIGRMRVGFEVETEGLVEEVNRDLVWFACIVFVWILTGVVIAILKSKGVV